MATNLPLLRNQDTRNTPIVSFSQDLHSICFIHLDWLMTEISQSSRDPLEILEISGRQLPFKKLIYPTL